MAEEGVYLPPSQFEGLFLSSAHTEEHIEKTVQAFHTVFEKLSKK
jgi:glutamate-1-semialdehyde 2,1-aminomutase